MFMISTFYTLAVYGSCWDEQQPPSRVGTGPPKRHEKSLETALTRGDGNTSRSPFFYPELIPRTR